MKISGRNIESFLRGADETVAAVLFYGPDAGLVRERAERLTAAVAGDAADPFRISELTAERLRDQPSLLSDEAAALSFAAVAGSCVFAVRATVSRQPSNRS